MSIIVAEHFGLTPAIRAHVEENLAKIRDLLPRDAAMRVFLSEPSRSVFRVLYLVRAWGKEFVARVEENDLYLAADHARGNIIRKILGNRDRKIHHRRHMGKHMDKHML